MAPVIPHWPRPSHSDLINVVDRPGDFTSGALSLVNLPAGSLFTRITTATPVGNHAYSSVQVSSNAHIELNSDLIYCNHSCAPSLIFDMARLEVRVVDDKPLIVGDPLTFFYPSSEWDMAQPFDCTCGAPMGVCKGRIAGAKHMTVADLDGYWLNEHIVRLLSEASLNAQANGSEKLVKPHGTIINSHAGFGVTSRELSGEMGGDTSLKVNGGPGVPRDDGGLRSV
ncbi:MAG: hypothetical protein M1833_001516 [Piccolia ochrophora]|nr:MAG: hypothetical protein M1833_001516 [Piccolia ochrophora]